jgi:hypothetical protein
MKVADWAKNEKIAATWHFRLVLMWKNRVFRAGKTMTG